MNAKTEVTYTDGSSEVRRFETVADAIDFLRLCEARYQMQRRGLIDDARPGVLSFEMLP